MKLEPDMSLCVRLQPASLSFAADSWRRVLFATCLTILLSSAGWNSAHAGDVALFVQGVDAKDARSAIWLEGVWTSLLKKRVQTPEASFGVIPKLKMGAIPAAKYLFKEGQKLYADLDFDKAAKKFRKAVRLFESALPYGDDFQTFSRIWCFIGVNYLLNGKKRLGKQAFQRAILLHPSASLQGISKDQKKINIFKRIKNHLISGQKSSLRITSSVPASLFINGRYIGVTPFQSKLPPGTHVVVLHRPGYRRWGKVIALSSASFALKANLVKQADQPTWKAAGTAASVHTLKHNGMSEAVETFSAMTKAKFVVLAQVQMIKNGSFLAVQAAIYNSLTKKQIAAGGALIPLQNASNQRAIAARLLQALLSGRDVSLEGWTPTSIRMPQKPGASKGKGNGALIGVGITLGLLAIGGGTVLVLYLTNPNLFKSCPEDGGCAQLTIR